MKTKLTMREVTRSSGKETCRIKQVEQVILKVVTQAHYKVTRGKNEMGIGQMEEL